MAKDAATIKKELEAEELRLKQQIAKLIEAKRFLTPGPGRPRKTKV